LEYRFISRGFHSFGGLFPLAKYHILTTLMARSPVLELTKQRRSAVRYKLRLPVIFHWTEETDQTYGGFTSDISVEGALILSSHCPPIGADVRVEILIPAPDSSTEGIRIDFVGMVTRVSTQPPTFGVTGRFDDSEWFPEALM
jgi:hypothetical protein